MITFIKKKEEPKVHKMPFFFLRELQKNHFRSYIVYSKFGFEISLFYKAFLINVPKVNNLLLFYQLFVSGSNPNSYYNNQVFNNPRLLAFLGFFGTKKHK